MLEIIKKVNILGCETMKHLGLISNKKFNIVKELSDEEYVYIHNHNAKIQEILMEVKFIDDVVSAFSVYEQGINDIKEVKNSNKNSEKDINRLVSSYLTEVKAFLDHWETYIKRKSTKNLLMLNRFKKITSKFYDENFSYRFVYSLRNFVQHCGKCITTIISSLDEYDNVHIDILAEKNYLLEEFHWKETIKKDLINMPDFIDIDLHLKIMNQCIIKVQNDLINERMNPYLIESCIELLSVKQLYNDFPCVYSILEFENNDLISMGKQELSTIKMGTEEIPMGAIEGILTQFYKNNFMHDVKIFSMKGILVGKNLIGLPKREKKNLIHFYSGCQLLVINGDKWQRIIQSTSVSNIDSPDKLFSIYIKGDFTFTELRKMQAMACSIRDAYWNVAIS